MRRIAALVYLAFLAACVNRAAEHAPDNRTGTETEPFGRQNRTPAIQFYVRPLVVSEGAAGRQSASVWSQNDDVDSITIVIAEAEGMMIREAGVDLLGRLAVEGDARIDPQPLVPPIVRWITLTDIKVDSLPSAPGGRRLLAVRPSVLWDQYRARAGSRMVVDSLHVTVDMLDGPRIVNGLALLWD